MNPIARTLLLLIVSCLLALLTMEGMSRAETAPLAYFKADTFQPAKPAAIPYGPPRAHPIATECALNDLACVKRHDNYLLDVAITAKDVSYCAGSTRPVSCDESVMMILGEVALPPGRILADPCAVVLMVHGGWATVFSPRWNMTQIVASGKLEPMQKVGACGCGAVKGGAS